MVHKRLTPYVLIVAAVLLLGASSVSASDASSPDQAAGQVSAPLGLGVSYGPADAALHDNAAIPAPPEEDQATVDQVGPASGEPVAAEALPPPGFAARSSERHYFPGLLDPSKAATLNVSYSVAPSPPAGAVGRPDLPDLPILANNQILAFYGHPLSKRMGILGEYTKEDLCRLVKGYARLYDEANGPQGVVPAFYLIYGTCWPGGEIGYLKDSIVQDYVNYAASQGLIVYVDHQIGKFTVEEAMRRLLPWLKYPNVHLALDPEWRTTAPMQEIGSITAEEVNKAQAMMRDYMNAQGISGTRMLVVHQFRPSMITGWERVKADNDRVLLVHTADGFGSPALKKNTYASNARAGNMPLKGFKLFFKTTVPGAGYDEPLLTPPEVVALTPRPVLVIYQ